jgi:hypothetical protein
MATHFLGTSLESPGRSQTVISAARTATAVMSAMGLGQQFE